MADRVRERFALTPEWRIADTACGPGPMLDWRADHRIAPQIPVNDKPARREGTFERVDFTCDAETDTCICPGGKALKRYRRAFRSPRSGADKDGTIRNRARNPDCGACAVKPRCWPQESAKVGAIELRARPGRGEDHLPNVCAISCKLRKKVEMLCGHLNSLPGLGRRRLRGPSGACDAFDPAATARKLRLLATLLPLPTIASPA